MVTVKSIANELGLSSATVSRTLRNDKTLSISAETRMRILMTAEQMGYIKKKIEKKSNSSEKKVVVIHKQQTFRHQIDSSYYYAVRMGIEDRCNEMGFQFSFSLVENLEAVQVAIDGAIIVGNYSEEQYTDICCKMKDIPMVSVGVVSYYPEKIDHITHSNKESIKIALDFLFSNGHKKIGYLGVQEVMGTELFGSRKQLFVNYMESLALLNRDWILECEHGSDRVEQGYLTTNMFIEKNRALPTAIFCANDPIALGAIKALHDKNIDVPGEISIVAHDGSYPTQYSYPPLTTVDVHPYQLGIESVTSLSERILNKRKIGKKIFLHPELVIRESVRNLGLKL